jgi:hypothetical protein
MKSLEGLHSRPGEINKTDSHRIITNGLSFRIQRLTPRWFNSKYSDWITLTHDYPRVEVEFKTLGEAQEYCDLKNHEDAAATNGGQYERNQN